MLGQTGIPPWLPQQRRNKQNPRKPDDSLCHCKVLLNNILTTMKKIRIYMIADEIHPLHVSSHIEK